MIRNITVAKNIINLDGPDGNAYYLLALATRLCREIGYVSDEKETIFSKMQSGDYINLVKTFDEYFGEYVILDTENEELTGELL